MSSIQMIIEKLGYAKSENLFLMSEINQCNSLSWHDKRVLHELSPYAVYVVDGSVLVAFFNNLQYSDNLDIQCKIWNAQIPIVISDEGNVVNIYNGKSMSLDNQGKMHLSSVTNYSILECDEESDFSYWNATNSLSLDEFESKLVQKGLNEHLIENLRFITKKLKEEFKITFANKLVLRILFIRYLIDRGINIDYNGLNNNIESSQKTFLEIVQDKTKLFSLFKYLKRQFNGNLFEMDEKKETKEINDDSLNLLYEFLTGKIEMKSGQMCLFPFYDFNIIPIELISNIYEILLGKEKQDKDKAFYTPEYLVDYIIKQTVENSLENKQECVVLDPSCGSGIFLVKALRAILEKNVEKDGFITDKSKINCLIKKNIFGVDYNEESVDVTIFSLYITLFDYQDPKNLKDFRLPLLKGENIIYGDFFDDNILKSIDETKFDYIIGNPPWGEIKHQKLYKKYCKNNNIKLQNGEISVAFLAKVQEIGGQNTECSLVLPSKILYKGKSPSHDFRKRLLTRIKMKQILEISAVRKQIFKGAIAPAVVMSFICKVADDKHKIEYISLKPNKYLKLFGIIMIEPDDIKYVKQKMLIEHDNLWKILVYGSYWDFELINNMSRKMIKIKDVEKKYNLQHGKGIQDHEGDKKDSTHLMGRKILNSDGCINHFRIDLSNLKIFNKAKIHRPREKELFEPPYVFFKKGLDCNDYSIRAVYTEERLVYKETVNCIKGSKDDMNVLLNITGLLNSSLFAYFNLMLGSSVGIEREQVFLKELENFPYIYSEELVDLVKKTQFMKEDEETYQLLRNDINTCVLNMYGVQDNPFVDYAMKIQIPLLCGRYVETKSDLGVLKKYAKVFSEVWEGRLKRIGLDYSINLYPNIKNKFAAFEFKFSFKKVDNKVEVINNVDNNIDILTRFAVYKLNDCFYQTKNVVQFEEESFVIVKSIDSKNWHQAMAVKDSYSILNTVLLGEEHYI